MTEIKSEKAECLLNAAKQSNINGCPVSLSAAMQAVILAKTELAETHAKELQEMKGLFDCDKYHSECNHEIELQSLKDNAVEVFKKYLTDYRGLPPTEKQYNEILDCFITELNK